MQGGVGFAFEVERWKLKTSNNANTILREAVVEFVRRVIERTPEDKSARRDDVVAKGDWATAVGHEPDDVKRNDASGRAALAEVTSVVAQWKPNESFGDFLRFWRSKGGGELFIANYKPYIRRLEYEGHSNQAPSGMLGVTVQEWDQIIEQQAAKHGSA